jgi:hypothetical protein
MVLKYMFLSLYDEVTNVLCVSLLSHYRYQYDRLILSKQTWPYPRQHLQQLLWCVVSVHFNLLEVEERKLCLWYIPTRRNHKELCLDCVSTTLTVLITLCQFFIVTLHIVSSHKLWNMLLCRVFIHYFVFRICRVVNVLAHRTCYYSVSAYDEYKNTRATHPTP